MKPIYSFILLYFLSFNAQSQRNATITVVNNTGQDISNLKYFRGTEIESSDPQKRFASRAGLKKGASTTIPITFRNKRDRKIIVKGELVGGGETNDQEHTLEKDEVTANIELTIAPGQLPKDPVQISIAKTLMRRLSEQSSFTIVRVKLLISFIRTN